jgi:hypothetical protein
MTILIKRDPNIEPFDPLAVIEELPSRWNGPHVGRRITEGFATFRALPLGDKGGAAPAWPPLSQPAARSFTSTRSPCGCDHIGQFSFKRVSALDFADGPPRCFST